MYSIEQIVKDNEKFLDWNRTDTVRFKLYPDTTIKFMYTKCILHIIHSTKLNLNGIMFKANTINEVLNYLYEQDIVPCLHKYAAFSHQLRYDRGDDIWEELAVDELGNWSIPLKHNVSIYTNKQVESFEDMLCII